MRSCGVWPIIISQHSYQVAQLVLDIARPAIVIEAGWVSREKEPVPLPVQLLKP